jgi:hypothetical protein
MKLTHEKIKDGSKLHYYTELPDFTNELDPAKLQGLHFQTKYGFDAKSEWCGSLSFNEAKKMLTDGAPAITKMLELRDKLATKIRLAPAIATYMDVTGGSQFDIAAFNEGIPECVVAYREEETRSRKTISIFVEIGQACGVSEDSMRRRGAAIMALIDLLEKSNQYQVAVYGVISATKSGSGKLCTFQSVIRLKAIGHQYDPNALGFCIAQPSFFRRLCFAHFDLQKDGLALGIHGTQAYGRHDGKASIPAISAAIDEKELVIDMMQKMYRMPEEYTSDARCEAYVLKQLEFYNVAVE